MLIISQSACGINDPAQPQSAAAVSFGEDWLLNTYCYIKIFDGGKEDLIKDTFKYARELENQLSRTVKGSVVSRFNETSQGEYISLSDENTAAFSKVISDALIFSSLTDGLFDPSIGAVSSLWDFTAESPSLPDAGKLSEALSHVGYEKIMIDESLGIAKSEDGVMIDLGAIAKGYIADMAAERLVQNGISSAIVSLGGNIVLIGSKPDNTAWRIGIEKPFSGNRDEILENRESIGMITRTADESDAEPGLFSVVTSGTYERCFEAEGKLYHHVIDPFTGCPRETDLISVTVTGPSSTYCDALSTSCLLMGCEKAKDFMDHLDLGNGDASYEYVMIKDDGSIIASGGAGFEY